MKISALGLAWYRQEDYPRILGMMADACKLPKTFEEWEKIAILTEKQMIAHGHIIVRTIVNPDEFVRWCNEKGKVPDRQMRGHYVAEITKQKLNHTKPTDDRA
jgi:hypothetical protein